MDVGSNIKHDFQICFWTNQRNIRILIFRYYKVIVEDALPDSIEH